MLLSKAHHISARLYRFRFQFFVRLNSRKNLWQLRSCWFSSYVNESANVICTWMSSRKEKKKCIRVPFECFLSVAVSIISTPNSRATRNKKEYDRTPRTVLGLSKNARALTNPVDVFMLTRKDDAQRVWALCYDSKRTADIFRSHWRGRELICSNLKCRQMCVGGSCVYCLLAPE